ncbi:unnamed protein product [Lepeophtheirus salmonis]|uniref:E3 ubiquitin-protein ligase E3D n=1 Tax=Lepeophtheirus salmonis TaxID=72036 RepID=A0A7R8CC02_LEPSM|nr:unnamed protein product [Lepeophtheirus salmonis]CAF2761189.1 unnamed protein product [Lepeophtheirus salmonis]
MQPLQKEDSTEWDLWGEYRGRFSSFHGIIRISSPFQFSSVEASGSNVIVKGVHRKIVLSFPGNIQFSGKLIYIRTGDDPNQILFALHTLGSNTFEAEFQKEFELLPSVKSHKESQVVNKYPFVLDSNEIENVNLSLRCKSCNEESISLVATRVTALPSSDWKEGAASWFCGCKHDPSKIVRLADTIRDGVLMWTETMAVIPYASRESVICNKCHSPLGYHENDSANFWLHSIKLIGNNKKNLLRSYSHEESFVSFLIDGLNSSPTILVPKIILKGNDLTLCLRVMDTQLNVYQGNHRGSIRLMNAFKLLYGEGSQLPKDELNEWMRYDVRVSILQVPDDVIQNGPCLLEKNKSYAHPDDHVTQGFNVSFLLRE